MSDILYPWNFLSKNWKSNKFVTTTSRQRQLYPPNFINKIFAKKFTRKILFWARTYAHTVVPVKFSINKIWEYKGNNC